ncbi:MAG: hypothetical protein IPN20_00175 [Haliscomenobacter sp.]|nr:hypothetical protein [Haliscomenobacter sp.]
MNHSYLNINQQQDPSNQDTYLIYNNLSTNGEVREVLLLVEEIRLKLFKHQILFNHKPSFRFEELQPILTPYDTVSTMYTRILELKYRSEYNYVFLCREKGFDQLLTDYKKLELTKDKDHCINYLVKPKEPKEPKEPKKTDETVKSFTDEYNEIALIVKTAFFALLR